MEMNFVFCEWELYVGTAPEQNTKSAQKWLKFDVSATFLYNNIFGIYAYVVGVNSAFCEILKSFLCVIQPTLSTV